MRVEFEVLMKTAGGSAPSAVETLDDVRPAPGDLVRCERWLAGQGVEAHRTEFSVVCSCERVLFERLFAARLVETAGQAGAPPFAFEAPPVIPEALGDCVAGIELTGRPIFFP